MGHCLDHVHGNSSQCQSYLQNSCRSRFCCRHLISSQLNSQPPLPAHSYCCQLAADATLLKISAMSLWGGQCAQCRCLGLGLRLGLGRALPSYSGQLYFIQMAAVAIWHASSPATTTAITATANELCQIQGRAAHFMAQKPRRRQSKRIPSNPMQCYSPSPSRSTRTIFERPAVSRYASIYPIMHGVC